MKGILKIEQFPNGAHQNQLGQIGNIPDGWAVIPDDMEIPQTFPFVNIAVEEVTHYEEYTEMEAVTEKEPYGVMTVTSMTEGVMPEPMPESEPEPTTDDVLNALLGVTSNE